MTATYKMATKHQQVAKDIVRAAKELNMTLWFRCNKQLHQVEFQLETKDEHEKERLNTEIIGFLDCIYILTDDNYLNDLLRIYKDF